jgi:perosamine synthetase
MPECRNIPFARPWVTPEDRRAVMEALDAPVLMQGPQAASFEREFASFLGDGAHCVAVSSCVAALHLAYLVLRIGTGDEVVVPAQAHTTTVHAVEWVGAKPVFVDCDPTTGNVTAEGVAAAVTLRTRAISVVHFVGIPCQMDAIMAVAEECNLKVIEDCALALGARYRGKHVGLFGDVGCFSFYPARHITTGEGGMFVSRHREAAESARSLRALGVNRTLKDAATPGLYDVQALGFSYGMSELQAALGRAQLRRIEENLARRRANFEALEDQLSDLPNVRILGPTQPDAESSHFCLTLVLERRLASRRNEVVARLNAAGIGTNIYYPQPVPRMSYYRGKYGYDVADSPQAEQISDHSLALPVGPHMSAQDISYMAREFRKTLRNLDSVLSPAAIKSY